MSQFMVCALAYDRYVILRHRKKSCSSAKTHISTTHNKDFTRYIVNVAIHRNSVAQQLYRQPQS